MARSAKLEAPLPPPLINADEVLKDALETHKDNPEFWSSKQRDRTDSAHCIFQYPAMMVPIVQRRLLAAVMDAQPAAKSLYDPFVGSGTSLVSGMHFGLDVYGNDINPLAILISRTRTSPRIEFCIGPMAHEVAAKARKDRRQKIETDLVSRSKWFKDEVSLELSRLRRAIRECDELWVRRFMWVTLAETIRLTSNDRTSTYKLHVRPEDEVRRRELSPIAVFSELATQNAQSFTAFRNALRKNGRLKEQSYAGKAEIKLQDTRTVAHDGDWPPSDGFDLMMTSPPYGDNLTTVTYGQHSYLPLHWIDLEDIDPAADIDALRTTQEIDRRSLGGRALTPDETDALYEEAPALKTFARALGGDPSDAGRRLVRFYSDFRLSLQAMTKLMNPNAYMIWTVGNRSLGGRQVPTDQALEELLAARGVVLVTTLTRQIHHKRMAVRNASATTMREEKILLLRKLA